LTSRAARLLAIFFWRRFFAIGFSRVFWLSRAFILSERPISISALLIGPWADLVAPFPIPSLRFQRVPSDAGPPIHRFKRSKRTKSLKLTRPGPTHLHPRSLELSPFGTQISRCLFWFSGGFFFEKENFELMFGFRNCLDFEIFKFKNCSDLKNVHI
jgi:hypothetical protein